MNSDSQTTVKHLISAVPDLEVHGRDDGSMTRDEFSRYGLDRTRRYEKAQATHIAVAFPRTVEDIAGLVRAANEHGFSVVPSGGRTGYSGGAIAMNGEVVISLDRMQDVLEFDPHLPALTVQAGISTAALRKEAWDRGLYFPIDFTSAVEAQIGGNVATNAGGLEVIQYGSFRRWVLGLTVITGLGEILELGGNILKDNTGYDLTQLLVGSEGTLGIIAEATLRLTLQPSERHTAIIGVDDFSAVLQLLDAGRQIGHEVCYFEFIDSTCMEYVLAEKKFPLPLSRAYRNYVVIQLDTVGPSRNPVAELVSRSSIPASAIDSAINGDKASAILNFRRMTSESLTLSNVVHKNDLSIPLPKMKDFCSAVRRKAAGFTKSVALFGHIGDCNLHVNLVKPDAMPRDHFFAECADFDEWSYARVLEDGGSISAEHGVGLLKSKALSRMKQKQPALRIMRKIKKVFDPNDVLNPGKLFADGGSPGSAAKVDHAVSIPTLGGVEQIATLKDKLRKVEHEYNKARSSPDVPQESVVRLHASVWDVRRELTTLLAHSAYGRAEGALHVTRVLLSYAHKDNEPHQGGAGVVDAIYQELKDRGIEVVRDVDSFGVGTFVSDEWSNNMAQVDKVIVLHSAAWKASTHCRAERELALAEQRRRAEASPELGPFVLTFRFDSTPVEGALTAQKYGDLNGKPFNQAVDLIVDSILEGVASPRRFNTQAFGSYVFGGDAK
jgi:FAD/FMN-containing dehydrogenase